MKLNSSSYMMRLLILCVILGTIPVAIVGTFSYYRSAYTVQKKVNTSNMQVLNQTHMRVEQLLKSADKTLTYIADLSSVNYLMIRSLENKDFSDVAEVDVQIKSFQTYDMGINDICLISETYGWVLNSGGFFRLAESVKKDRYLEYMKINKGSEWVSELSELKTDDLINSDRFFNIKAVKLVKKVPINAFQPQGVAVLSMPCTFLNKLLAIGSGTEKVIILDNGWRLLASTQNENPGKEYGIEKFVGEINQVNTTEGFITSVLGNEKVNINFIKSAYNGWTYVSIVPMSEITKDARAIGWFTFLICLIVLVITMVLSFFGSRRMYKPIHSLYQSIHAVMDAGSNTRGNDELKVIEERVNFLLSSQTKMKSQIYNQLNQLREFFVLKLVQGELDKKEIDDKLTLYGYASAKKWMSILVLQIDTLEGAGYKENDRDLMMFAINNIISELIQNELLLTPIISNRTQVTILGGNHDTYEEFKNFVYQIAEKIQNMVFECLHIQANIGISQPFHVYKDAYRAYCEGIEALKYQIKLGYNSILFSGDIHIRQGTQLLMPVKMQNELVDAVKVFDYDKARQLLHNYLEELFKMDLKIGEYQVHLIRILTDFVQIIQDTGESHVIMEGNDTSLFEQLEGLKTVNEIENWFNNTVIGPIMRVLEEKSLNQHSRISSDLKFIIEEEYDTDLTIEECASRMNYHPSYIRRIFKKETGTNFSEYLALYRMNRAKKWLSETDMKISDIAERLRYNNSQNFIRSFRKVEGITPGQYRERKK